MWWLLFFSGAVATPLQKFLFSEEVADDYGAKCLDGTAAGYYLRDVAGSKDWVFFLQGGGLCIDIVDCLARAKSHLGSSKNWSAAYDDQSNVLNSNSAENPFAGFNAVYVPYCSGDTYLGIKKDKNIYLGDLYTNGHLILEAILDHLHNTTSMRDGVGKVLFSGESAGGIGVIHNADWLTRVITQKFAFSDAVVKASPQSGLFFPSRPSVGVCLFQEYWLFGQKCPRLDIFESWYVRHEEHAFVDQNCASDLADASRCWDSGILARYVKTPLFIAQNRYDQNQISNEFLCQGCNSYPGNSGKKVQGYMTYFGNRTENTLRDLADNFGHSVFMPNCFAHTDNMCMKGGLIIDGESYNTSLSDWFFQGHHHTHFDVCGELPCSQVCDCHSKQADDEDTVLV